MKFFVDFTQTINYKVPVEAIRYEEAIQKAREVQEQREFVIISAAGPAGAEKTAESKPRIVCIRAEEGG